MSILNVKDLFIDEFTETCEYNAVEYDCIALQLTADEQYQKFGLDINIDFSLILKVSDFDALPEEGDIITFRSMEYRIAKIIVDSDNATLEIALTEKYGNA